jgi:hypothetical protein
LKNRFKSIDSEDVVLAIVALIMSVCMICYAMSPSKKSDEYVRDRVLQLKGPRGACTGAQVKAPSGDVYTLTAAHCREILDSDNSATAIDEQGREKKIYLLDIDESKDLMLMSSTSHKSIDIAKKTVRHEHVHTITHGKYPCDKSRSYVRVSYRAGTAQKPGYPTRRYRPVRNIPTSGHDDRCSVSRI